MGAVAQWTKEIYSAEVTVLSHLVQPERPSNFDELRQQYLSANLDNYAQFWWRDEQAKVLSRLFVRMPNLVTVGTRRDDPVIFDIIYRALSLQRLPKFRRCTTNKGNQWRLVSAIRQGHLPSLDRLQLSLLSEAARLHRDLATAILSGFLCHLTELDIDLQFADERHIKPLVAAFCQRAQDRQRQADLAELTISGGGSSLYEDIVQLLTLPFTQSLNELEILGVTSSPFTIEENHSHLFREAMAPYLSSPRPCLRYLTFEAARQTNTGWDVFHQALAAGHVSELKHLTFRTYGDRFAVPELSKLLREKAFPILKHLEIDGACFTLTITTMIAFLDGLRVGGVFLATLEFSSYKQPGHGDLEEHNTDTDEASLAFVQALGEGMFRHLQKLLIDEGVLLSREPEFLALVDVLAARPPCTNSLTFLGLPENMKDHREVLQKALPPSVDIMFW